MNLSQLPNIFDRSGMGMQVSSVRQVNMRTILTLIATNPGITPAELSRQSQLAPQTVSAILAELDQIDLLRRGEVVRGRRGQPAQPYFLNFSGAYAIGAEIGWRHIDMVLVNVGGEILSQYHRDYRYPDARTIISELSGVSSQFIAKLGDEEASKLVGLGIAAPTAIGRNIDLLSADPDLSDAWQKLDLKTAAEEATGLAVYLYNDGNAACWAELSAHPAPRPTSFAYVLISTFIAAGIVAQGVLWEGSTGNSANIGSMLVPDKSGNQTFGHLVASIYALEKKLVAAGVEVPPTSPQFWPWSEWELTVTAWIDDAAPTLAMALMNAEAVLEFGQVVVDGPFPGDVLDRLIDAVSQEMAKLPTLTFDAPAIARGRLGAAAPSSGAAYLPLFRRFFSRDLSFTALS